MHVPGRHLGLDAVATLLQNIRWSIAIMDVSPLTGGSDACESEEAHRVKVAAYRRYFERLHFKPGVPGGYAPSRQEPEPEEEESRYHWMSWAQFSARTSASQLCVVCMEAPQQMAMIHGDTAHTVCCRDCTTRIQARTNQCPICKAPISAVVRNFNG